MLPVQGSERVDRMLSMPPDVAAAIAAHAVAIYPDECVGLLLGRLDGEQKVVQVSFPVENRWSGQVTLAEHDDPSSRRDRFYLDPRDYMKADRAAQAAGLEIIGCYHSHPIGGPSFAFVIQSVQQGVATELASWLLIDTGARFIQEQLHLGEV